MDVRIKFLGAAQSVTGSRYLLEIDDFKLLIDCGLFQGLKALRLRNWDAFPVDASEIDAILLTHAHIDHSGYLPRLVKEGFKGAIHCTEATQGLLEIMLRDAAKLQVEEATFARKKGYSKHENPQPLFDIQDAEVALSLLTPHSNDTLLALSDQIKFIFLNAGHILGAAIVQLEIRAQTGSKTIIFSGDLGRFDQPILQNPTFIQEADIIVMESTYGNRNNDIASIENDFAQIINEAMLSGCLLIPSFAVGRTQLLLYYLHKLMEAGEIPKIPVYIDSPMAISATGIYRKYRAYHTLNDNLATSDLFDYSQFHYYRSQEASVDLNKIEKDAIIISASGMCTGGRILHHLYHRLPKTTDTILFVGYQAKGTRGRRILEKEESIRIFGINVPVKLKVAVLNGLSAHADRSELLRWASMVKGSPKLAFITHGELESANALAEALTKELHWKNVYVPDYMESFQLFQGI